ncbi:bifunctional helix-turn-helix domain-containing protein/methylated-DNA--[protein]-cysteine S-methyltransferase [Aurantimonas sp. Leaf443]|uniref:methylated-DNA--[protein]-cysteine S-methyltransferase n=1 Tax=Aurantimonas sp. Leaf443 TaxID=1736378 RepID=UPI0006F89EE7|nr:bifunctional helix-turn-helix domain-containing protein/methylated-DNA--[protein]-cysteine S-methyltransferase [Aurantimonas sp. Leaf443]KQT83105.1 6-O-methylguanine DNA methyltransferase [Aurantimonas sp. Leaf443]
MTLHARIAAPADLPAPGSGPDIASGGDYDLVRRTVEFISTAFRGQPTLAEIAHALQTTQTHLEATFRRWAGLSPKAFLQAVTIDHARRLLAEGLPLLDAAHEVGLSGPSRLHDLFVRHEAMSPGAHKARGEGIELTYGFSPSPFGRAIVVATGRGLAGIGFSDASAEGDAAALADMVRRWPKARFSRDDAGIAPLAARAFRPDEWRAESPLRVVLIGTDFEVRVWEALLAIPVGQATTYSDIATRIGSPKAPRAVGAAVGRNPVSFVVPCHRVVGRSGALTGYHWGLTRKRAMLGWECGLLAREG